MEVLSDQSGVSFSSADDLLSRSQNLQNNSYVFKFGEYINGGFRLFFKRPADFVIYFIVYTFISVLASFTGIGALIVTGPLTVGWFIVAYNVDNDEPFEFADFFKGFRITLPLILVTLLVFLSVFAGIIALIIPGIFLGVALSFSYYPVYFNNMEPVDAMKVSYRFVKKKWFSFFFFFIVLGLINFLGLLALGIGIFITAPATALALYCAYKDIFGIGEARH